MAQTLSKHFHNTEQTLTTAVRSFVKNVWNTREIKLGKSQRIPIGVCVSGGPDSMALAYLLKQVSKSDEIRTKPVAFVVNHNARKGSGEEAKYVGWLLQKLGIGSEILEMRWPHAAEPASLPDFEMQARRARYRLIAKAAIRKQVSHLFLGHHQDDQIETILMRLIRNSSDSFLGRQGIPEHSSIPCCEDIRGAQTTKEHARFGTWLREISGTKIKIPRLEDHKEKDIAPSTSGIQIHRPLLAFPKSDIIQFCALNEIPYVLDKTNFDPTLTLRNAIRYMRSQFTLPRALQGPSILEVQRQAQHHAKSLSSRGDSVLKESKVYAIDLRSGCMTVQFSPHFQDSCTEDPEAGAYALARLTGVVSPQSKDDNEPTLVPQQNLRDLVERNSHETVEQMTIQQVLMEKSESASVTKQTTKHEVEDGTDDANLRLLSCATQSTTWNFSRPPMRARELEIASMAFQPSLRHNIDERAKMTKNSREYRDMTDKRKGIWSEWLLWDHRYWIRIRTKDAKRLSTIRIRPYTEPDAHDVYKRLGDNRAAFQAILAEAAPGKSRYTIPVLTTNGRVSVFPTLNVKVRELKAMRSKSSLSAHPMLEWEVCYKVLDQAFVKDQSTSIEWRNA